MRNLPVIEERVRTKKQIYQESVRAVCQNLPLEKTDANATAIGKFRLKRTLELLKDRNLSGCEIIDIGSGSGAFAKHLRELEASVSCVDAALPSNLDGIFACMPYLPFPDESFDGALFTDVIAFVEPHLYRLTFSELARLIKKEGWLLCSTPLDLHSIDAREQFEALIETEFTLIARRKSYHRLHFYLTRSVQAPARFVRASRDPQYRQRQMQKRHGLSRFWFYFQSMRLVGFFWKPLAFLIKPLTRFVIKNSSLITILEFISKGIWGEGALTHLIVLAKKKNLTT